MLGPMAATYKCRRENSRPEPVFRFFSKALAFAFDMNAFHFGVAAFTCAALQAEDGPDWARTSDPALIKRML